MYILKLLQHHFTHSAMQLGEQQPGCAAAWSLSVCHGCVTPSTSSAGAPSARRRLHRQDRWYTGAHTCNSTFGWDVTSGHLKRDIYIDLDSETIITEVATCTFTLCSWYIQLKVVRVGKFAGVCMYVRNCVIAHSISHPHWPLLCCLWYLLIQAFSNRL